MKKVYEVEKNNYEDAGQVSRDIKRILKTFGIEPRVLKRIAIACYEAEINLVIHSDGGTVTFELTDDGIVYLSFDDIGPGIADLSLALTPGYSTASDRARSFGFGAGMGLDNMRNCSSSFDISSSDQGTHLRMNFI